MNGARRYILTLKKVPPEDRDKFRALQRPETYREIKPGEVGERVLYSVDLSEGEYQQALRDAEDPQSNLIRIEENQVGRPGAVPDHEPLRYMAADFLPSLGATGKGVDVGVIDSGLSRTVAEMVFAGRIKAARHGESTTDLETGEVTRPDPFVDEDGHGTYMAGLAVPPRSQLVLTTTNFVLDHAIEGLYWQVDDVGVDVINMSLGYLYSEALCDAVHNAATKGVLVLACAFNGGEDNTGPGENIKMYPAACPGALAISNYDWRTDAITEDSNYGDHLFAAAPGQAVVSYARDGSEEFWEYGGTSSATAHATRIAASLIHNPSRGTKRDPNIVRDHLAKTARKTGASPLYEGNGVLQAGAALRALREWDCPQPEPTTTRDIRFVLDASGTVKQVK